MNTKDKSSLVFPPEPLGWSNSSLLRLRENKPVATASLTSGAAASNSIRRWQRLRRRLAILVCVGGLSVTSYYLLSRAMAPTLIVQDNSLSPILQEGSRLTLYRWSYVGYQPRRGDLVVVQGASPKDYEVKRIIATPYESIYFKDGELLVNGEPLKKGYLPPGTQTVLSEFQQTFLVMGKDQYFVLGHNGAKSQMCRYGSVHRSKIIGSIAPPTSSPKS